MKIIWHPRLARPPKSISRTIVEVLRVDSYQKVVHTQNCQMLYDQKITYEFASRMSKYLIVHTNRRPDNFLQPHPINLLSHSRRQQSQLQRVRAHIRMREGVCPGIGRRLHQIRRCGLHAESKLRGVLQVSVRRVSKFGPGLDVQYLFPAPLSLPMAYIIIKRGLQPE